jgi:hypothetical protein
VQHKASWSPERWWLEESLGDLRASQDDTVLVSPNRCSQARKELDGCPA